MIAAEYVKDSWATGLIKGTIQDDMYTVIGDLILYKDRIYLVPSSHFKEVILKIFQDASLASHSRFFKTYKKIWESFTWKGLKNEVPKYVRECPVCKKNKNEHTFPTGLLQPLLIPDQKWESVFMDFIT